MSQNIHFTAQSIFEYFMEEENSTEDDSLMWLENLATKYSKSKFSLIRKLSSRLKELILEYCEKKDLCQDCYHAFTMETIKDATLYEPAESIKICPNCGNFEM